MRGRGWIWAGLVLLLLLVPAVTLASSDPLVPARPEAAPGYGQKVPLYDDPRFAPWNYTFEGQDWNRADYATIYFWMNQLQVAKAWGLKMSIRVAEYAVHADLVKPLLQGASTTLRALETSLWSAPGAPLVIGGLALAGLWAMLLYMRGRVTRAWGALGGSVLLLLLWGVVMSGGERALESSLALSRGVSVEIFNAADQATKGDSGMGLLARGGDAVWRTLVYEPWLTGELSASGRTAYRTADGLDGGSFLAMSVTQRHNVCLYNLTQAQASCPWWELEYLPRRMLLAFWTTLTSLVVAWAIAGLGGAIVLAQLTLLLFLALAPVWLMAALWWPEAGIRLLRGVLTRAAGVLLAQGLLAASLAALLLLFAGVNASLNSAGWMLNSVMLAALAYLVFRYRYAWLTPLPTLVEHTVRRTVQKGRRAQDLQGDAALRPADAAAHEAIPVFATVPEALVSREATQEPRHLVSYERERIRANPTEIFRTQVERLREELVLRQETLLYDRTLESTNEQTALGTTAVRERQPHSVRQSPDIQRMQPPRPTA